MTQLVIGHRGNPAEHPENSLAGIYSALAAGVPAVEIDVHLSSDHVPYVIHDSRLERTTNGEGEVRQSPSSYLNGLCLKPTDPTHGYTPLPRLTDVVDLMGRFPEARLFVEIKRETLKGSLNARRVVFRVCQDLGPIASRVVVLSFEPELITPVADFLPDARCGLALRVWPPQNWVMAFADYIFAKDTIVPETALLPPGFVVYDVMTAAKALEWFARGAYAVESSAPVRVHQDLRATP